MNASHEILVLERGRLDAMVRDGNVFSRDLAASRLVRSGSGVAYVVDRGIAVIEVNGLLTKDIGWYGSTFQEIANCLLAAGADPEVLACVLRVESPGGTMPGIDELADTIKAVDQVKPVYGFAEDMAASGGYYILSQTRKAVANRSAVLGGVGVYRVIVDSSAQAEKDGIKVHVVKAGERKGDGVPGTPVPDEMLAEAQKLVDAGYDRFVRAVASGRSLSLSKTRELADGRLFTAEEAKTLGLIDDIRAFDSFMDALATKHKQPKPKAQGARAMSEQTPSVENTVQNTAPRAATLQELKAELVGASSDFLLAQLEASATLPQASKAWIAELSAQNKAAAEARAAAEAKVAELEKKKPLAATKPGVDPLPTAATEGQSPENAIAAWESLVEAELKAMGKTQPTKLGSVTPRMRAQIAAAKKNPAAHAAYLVAHNTRKRAEYPNRNWNAMQLSPAAAIAADPASV